MKIKRFLSGFFFGLALMLAVTPAFAQTLPANLFELRKGPNNSGVGLGFALREGNQPAVAYFDTQTHAVTLQEFDGVAWSGAPIDSTLLQKPTVTLGGLVIHSRVELLYKDGIPHLFYINPTGSELKHAYRRGISWTFEFPATSVAGSIISAAECGDDICVTYYDLINNDLKMIEGNSQVWTSSIIDASLNDTGVMSSFTQAANGTKYIVYVDKTALRLKLATKAALAPQWSIEELSVYGYWPSVAVGTDNTIHIAYSGIKNSDIGENDSGVSYLRKESGGEWETQSVRDWGYGAYPALTLSAENYPFLAFRQLYFSGIFGNQRGPMLGTRQPNEIWASLKKGLGGTYYTYDYRIATDEWDNVMVAHRYRDGANDVYGVFGFEDADSDSIPNDEEWRYQTDVNDADSDNDNLADGLEVLIYGTDPLVLDTDGDGANDDTDADPLRPDGITNFVKDGSMEAPAIRRWDMHGLPLKIEKNTTQTADGNRSLRIKSRTGIAAGVVQHYINLAQTTRYLLRCDYKNIQGNFNVILGWGNETEFDGAPATPTPGNLNQWQTTALLGVMAAVGISAVLGGRELETFLRTRKPIDLGELLVLHLRRDEIEARSVPEFLRELSDKACMLVGVDADRIFAELWESYQQVAIRYEVGAGGFLPHGRFEEATKEVIILASVPEHLADQFDPHDGEPITTCIFLAYPEVEGDQWMAVMSKIARALNDPERKLHQLVASNATDEEVRDALEVMKLV